MITHQQFEDWLADYGRAWEASDAARYASLFTPDAEYWWTPFGPPKVGRESIVRAIEEAVARQQDQTFRYRILSIDGRRGIAHWTCDLTRLTTGKAYTIDGILMCEFADDGLCRVFREWWHSNE